MICGNEQQIKMLDNIIDGFVKNQIESKFILLEGMAHIGKTSAVIELVKKYIGNHFLTDFLYIQDLTEHIGKTHTLKVSTGDDDILQRLDGTEYRDYGTRQIIDWLSLSSVGKFKIVLIENIERMNTSSFNAFLKTLEEPLPNRLIIATTNNRLSLLDTILSRGMILSFNIPSNDTIINYLSKRYPQTSQQDLQLLISVCTGRIGLCVNILESNSHDIMNSNDFIRYYSDFIKLVDTKGNITAKMEILNNINKIGMLENFFIALVYYCNQNGMFRFIEKIFKTRKYIGNNVNVENALFYLILD